MLVDTHAHINMMVKKDFDTIMTQNDISNARSIIENARNAQVTQIINVGTSVPESSNCILLAQNYESVFAVVGIHPNDLTGTWKDDLKEIKKFLANQRENKIVGIGECGLDFHYPDYNMQRQKDAFKIQIELALEHNLGLVVHTRNAPQETLACLEEYKHQIKRGVIHCFSEQLDFAQHVIEWGFAMGIGGIITYPKNNYLREIVKQVSLESIVLETDAPFLPIQQMRGKQNAPQYIQQIAEYISQLRNESVELISSITTKRAKHLFNLP